MTTLGGMWDGEQHLLEVDEHFPSTGAYLVIEGFEEQEEEDVLGPFESHSVEPVLRNTQQYDDPKFPMRPREQAWGALSVCLTAFANIADVRKDQYQQNHNNGKTTETLWTFQSKEDLGERI